MIYWQLFVSFFQIGLFSFGGGYAAMPLIRQQVVELHSWLTPTQFTDIVTISQMTPGPIAVNSASFVGMQIAGIPGSVVATLGCVAPACVIVTVLAVLPVPLPQAHAGGAGRAASRGGGHDRQRRCEPAGAGGAARRAGAECGLGCDHFVCGGLCGDAVEKAEPHCGDGKLRSRRAGVLLSAGDVCRLSAAIGL